MLGFNNKEFQKNLTKFTSGNPDKKKEEIKKFVYNAYFWNTLLDKIGKQLREGVQDTELDFTKLTLKEILDIKLPEGIQVDIIVMVSAVS